MKIHGIKFEVFWEYMESITFLLIVSTLQIQIIRGTKLYIYWDETSQIPKICRGKFNINYEHTEWEYWEYAECIGGIMTDYLQDGDLYVEYV